MRFNLLITGGLYNSQAGYSALAFAKATIAAGHQISQVFFYQDGVTLGSRLSMPLDDEFEPVAAWAEFAAQNTLALVICVSAGERRGIMSDAQAAEFAKGLGSLHANFSVAGLGALHNASLESDRTVTFK